MLLILYVTHVCHNVTAHLCATRICYNHCSVATCCSCFRCRSCLLQCCSLLVMCAHYVCSLCVLMSAIMLHVSGLLMIAPGLPTANYALQILAINMPTAHQ